MTITEQLRKESEQQGIEKGILKRTSRDILKGCEKGIQLGEQAGIEIEKGRQESIRTTERQIFNQRR